ncbi:sulfate permease [Salinibacterium sp. G-O1]|uniref:sulfate permease n=1 Tax=Salinibacterium sp. G-O1 TaxID=3046208 RepID=UPI0024B8A462|nr:sulfate permease [Salinibacterium sp. G-O1]MDJ0334908.1 sulfate permease [Salinibacterium sp. G-O1]
MLRIIWIASFHIRQFMRRYMPTNILLNAIRTRRGLKWGVPAMLLALPYLYVASVCAALIDNGGPGWLYLIALVCVWNALKFVWIGPVSVGLLVRTRAAESRDAHASRPQRSSASA